VNKKVAPIPEGYHTLSPYLIVDNATKAIEFYQKAFGATVTQSVKEEGKVCHAELKVGDSLFMLADEFPERGAFSPKKFGGSAMGLHLYVENSDVMMKQAIDAGAEVVRPLENMFYGDRSGMVLDPYGYRWNISTHVEDVSPEEMKKRMDEMKLAQ
jgi:PhnB protein